MKRELTRRGFLTGTLATGGWLAMPRKTAAQAPRTTPPPLTPATSNMIDVHHHYLPPDFVTVAKAMGGNTPPWSVQISLDKMGKTGLATSILSISNPGVEAPNPADTPGVARMCNEYGAKVV